MPTKPPAADRADIPRWLTIVIVVVAVGLVATLAHMISTMMTHGVAAPVASAGPRTTPVATASPDSSTASVPTAWSKVLGASAEFDDVAAGPDDAVVAIGEVGATGGALPTDSAFPVSATVRQAVVAKFGPDGELAWAKPLAGDGDTRLSSVAVGADGAVAVTGITSSTSMDIPNVGAAGVDSAFLARLTSAGDVAWATTLATRPRAADLGASANPNFEAAVTTMGDIVALGTDDLTQGGIDAVAFDATGAKLWHSPVSTDPGASVIAVAPGRDGTVSAVASTTSSADGSSAVSLIQLNRDGTVGSTSALTGDTAITGVAITPDGSLITTAITTEGATVTKRGATGQVVWQTSVAVIGSGGLPGVAVTRDGGIVAVGATLSTLHGSANTDGLVVHLTPAGVVDWQRILGGSATDQFNAVAVTSDGGVVVAGSTASTDGNFPPATGVSASSPTPGDALIARLNADGTPANQ